MNLTSDPKELRELIRYYRRVARVNTGKNVPSQDYRRKEELETLRLNEIETCAKLRSIVGEVNVSTPEAWR